MTDDKDRRLSDLYRQSSREEPPARLDRAVMELAGKSVKRRSLAPFGNHWVAASTLAGICIASVLLVVLLQEQAGVQDLQLSPPDADAPAMEFQAEVLNLKSAADAVTGGQQESSAARPEVAGKRFDFYTILPEAAMQAPAKDRGVMPAAPPSPPLQATPAAGYFLEIGGFSTLAQAEAMLDKLQFMRLDARIQQGDGTQSGYRLRVGPYTDPHQLDRVQAQLDKRGIKSTREPVP